MKTNIQDRLRGTGVAMVTPFTTNNKVDYEGLKKLIEHILKGKCEYLVVLGTTGESATLSKEEKSKLISAVVKHNKKRVPLVLGIGGNNTAEVIENLKTVDLNGYDAILSVSPYYNKPNQRGIYEHYKQVCKASKLPVILYNVPGRTSMNVHADTTLALARDCKNIIAIKEASGNLEQVMKIIKYKPENFMVISGDDALTLPIIACGGDGVISVVANAFPSDFSEMVRNALKGKMEHARVLHYKLTDIIESMFADGNPAGVKEFLKHMKVCGTTVRLPLVNVNADLASKIKKQYQQY